MFPMFPPALCHGFYQDIANDNGATMCRSCLGDEDGFADWMGRVRDEWQAKLELLEGQDGEMLPEGILDTDDSCVPSDALQRSNVCSLLGQWHGGGKNRCIVSL